jgi:CheY-specific phosphatase CheX/anti-anti-sigma regulatory factor
LKPIIKQKVAIFSPIGFLDGENASETISPFDVDFLVQTKPEGAFISLKKVIFFNKRGITVLIESLIKVRDVCGTAVGFCDYDIKKYNMILDMFPNNLNFSLFDTAEIALLFVGDDLKNEKEKNILVYVEDSEHKNQLAMELYERGFSPIIAKNENDFLAKRKDAEFIIENAYLGKLDKTPTVFIKDNVIVYTLKGFVDSDISKKFDMIYHNNSLKVGFKLFIFDCDEVSSINIHGVNFIAKLSTAGAEYGISIVMCGLDNRKITEKLTNDLEDTGVLMYPSLKGLFDDTVMMKEAHESSSVAKKSMGITKKLISILPTIIDSSVKTIEVLSGYNAKKKLVKVQELNLKKDSGLLSASIGFYGDIDGILIMIFEKGIAKESCKILLEEDSSEEDILNALGEFTHIIGGKIAQQLHKHGTKIDITMPRTFEKVEDVMKSQKRSRGTQVDLDVDGRDLTLFLTR